MLAVTIERPTRAPKITIESLRTMFRGLNHFRIAAERGIDSVCDNEGIEWSIYDVEYLYEMSQQHLPQQMAGAIRLFLVGGQFESDVAEWLGTAPTNPVGMYATQGLKRIVVMIENGDFPRYRG